MGDGGHGRLEDRIRPGVAERFQKLAEVLECDDEFGEFCFSDGFRFG
jgi:hypothetical protein